MAGAPIHLTTFTAVLAPHESVATISTTTPTSPTRRAACVRTSHSAARLAGSGRSRTWRTSAAAQPTSTAIHQPCRSPLSVAMISHGKKKSAAAARAAAPHLSRALRCAGSGLVNRRLAAVALDELLGELARVVVLDLLGRRLHQVRARLDERAGDPVVQRELREPHGVDHDAGRVR